MDEFDLVQVGVEGILYGQMKTVLLSCLPIHINV